MQKCTLHNKLVGVLNSISGVYNFRKLMEWRWYKHIYLLKRGIRYLFNNRIRRRFLWFKHFKKSYQTKGHQSFGSYFLHTLCIDDFQSKIATTFEENNISIECFKIDQDELNEYSKAFLSVSPLLYKWVYKNMLLEKWVEFFFSLKVLNITPEDVVIDVASSFSVFPLMIRKNIGCMVYKQDIDYMRGLHKDFIGGNAKTIPLQDYSVTKISLHNSFEHFEGSSDMEFIKEASRLLKRGGKVCIVPLFVSTKYYNIIDPTLGRVDIDSGASVVYHFSSHSTRFERWYDVLILKKRILDNLIDLKPTIYLLERTSDTDESCYVKFAMVLEKK